MARYMAYLRDNPKGYWFKRKLYGWGWTPVRWQGWVSVGIYVVVCVYIFTEIDVKSHSGSDTLIGFVVPFLFLTGILVGICYLKGESPRFQWGIPQNKDEKITKDF